jgi:DNA helicase HerA-like ATPase
MESLGTVISTFDGPSTKRFCFVINREGEVRRGQFVQVESADGQLIGRVVDIRKSNRYFGNPETVQFASRPFTEDYPTWEWECLIGDVQVLGVWTGSGFQDSLFPASPGSSVVEPKPEILTKFFGFDSNGLNIGKLVQHNLDVKLNITRLFQKHLAILALSGAGKSHLVSVLIEELLKKPQSPFIVVIDPHGEYAAFGRDPNFAGHTAVFGISDIRIPLKSALSRLGSLFELTVPQIRILQKAASSFKNKFSISDIMSAVEVMEINQSTKDVLLGNLAKLAKLNIFGIQESPKIEHLNSRLVVIDLSGTISQIKRQLIVDYIARRLFRARQAGTIPPFLLIIEEAHQFVPEGVKRKAAICKAILQTIAREGRKFCASLCLVSQRPKRLDTTILSQCNSNFILRITNPYDLAHIEESSEGISKDVVEQISSLPVGNALIVGEAINFPLFVRIRQRYSKPSEKGKALEAVLKEWHEAKAQKVKDTKAFM